MQIREVYKSFCLIILLLSIIIVSCTKEEQIIIPTAKVEVISTLTNVSVKKMQFIEQNFAYAICENGLIFKTLNGGSTWDSAYTLKNIPDNIDDFIFLSSSKGYLVGNNKVFVTNDSSKTWTDANPGGNYDYKAISFPTKDCGYIAANDYIYKTTDGGSNWFAVNTPDVSFLPYKIVFSTPDTGIVTDYFHNKTYITTDGGNTWVNSTSHFLNHAPCIKFASKIYGYAVKSGYIYKSSDKGIIWSIVNAPSEENKFEYLSIDVKHGIGIAVGDMSIIISKSSGTNWIYHYTQDGINLNDFLTDVCIINKNYAIASSKSGKFYKIYL